MGFVCRICHSHALRLIFCNYLKAPIFQWAFKDWGNKTSYWFSQDLSQDVKVIYPEVSKRPCILFSAFVLWGMFCTLASSESALSLLWGSAYSWPGQGWADAVRTSDGSVLIVLQPAVCHASDSLALHHPDTEKTDAHWWGGRLWTIQILTGSASQGQLQYL